MRLLSIFLKGFSQVMLQKNPFTGAFFLIGIIFSSWELALGAILGNLTSNIWAELFKYHGLDIDKGLYGFNGVLCGIAIIFFLGFNFWAIILLIITSILSALIMKFMILKKWSPLTAPFVLATWIILLIVFIAGRLNLPAATIHANNLNFFSALSLGFAQVMFQANVITGLLFLVGLLISSKKVAGYGLFGSFLGIIIAVILKFPLDSINLGLFGFNAVLCGIAFSNGRVKNLLPAASAILLSVLIMFSFTKFNLIALTAPFVISTWIVVLIKDKIAALNRKAI